MRDRLLFRAPLFVPADRPERFAKAAGSGADAVILDLEDAVAPANKDAARRSLGAGFTDLPVLVRINPPGTPWHDDDLAAVAKLDLAALMLPKLAALEHLSAIGSGPAGRHPRIGLIESAEALANLRALAAAGLDRLAFGSIDFAADLGCAHDRTALLHARFEIVLASRLSALPAPLDGITTAARDRDLVFDDTTHGKSLGFGGKLCIHPAQIEPVLAAYRPSDEELAWARRVLGSGEGAVLVDGAMVDEPARQRARYILATERP